MRFIWQLLKLLVMVLVHGRRHNKAMANLRSMSTRQQALDAVLNHYRQGDYEAALQAAEGLEDGGKETSGSCFFRGTMLMHLGQLAEAEKCLRQNLAMLKGDQKGDANTKQTALGHATLGELLVHQRRYDEALECFTASLRYWPGRGATHRDIAEAWLRRGEPSEAFKWAKLAVEEDRSAEVVSQEIYNLNLSEDLATLAWAVAVASRDRTEVDRLVAEAVPLVGVTKVTSTTAQVHYYSGSAYAALGDFPTGGHHFTEAARIDPKGLWGRAAQAMATGIRG